ncbi:NUDIX hydrolase [Catenovulum agarivorans DS-2]|uniref:NUDIX hydrolase n=1 Tax=Catenovulum agarivorans DS-2 TaxID=1328313 RepID=W7QT16_9ALTE|nr:CoA pyrophosphatase [Catenovulum agarivorans]EWH12147.1 NUDIX hydrolase [Catenovulum agarivorans DS-2]
MQDDAYFNQILSRLLLRPRPSLRTRGYLRQAKAKDAAVLLLLVKAQKPYFLLTQRSSQLKHHANQVCLPGGRQDEGESLFATAVRETEEELAIPRQQIKPVTTMECIETPSGYRISPFIGYIPQYVAVKANAAEVAHVLTISVDEFLSKEINQQVYLMAGRKHKVLSFSHQQRLIWGATAAILDQFKRWLI